MHRVEKSKIKQKNANLVLHLVENRKSNKTVRKPKAYIDICEIQKPV